jgi:hypothetical protein
MDLIARDFSTKGKWTRIKTTAADPASALRSDWKFNDRDGKDWTGVLTIRTIPDKSSQYELKLTIARSGKKSG